MLPVPEPQSSSDRVLCSHTAAILPFLKNMPRICHLPSGSEGGGLQVREGRLQGTFPLTKRIPELEVMMLRMSRAGCVTPISERSKQGQRR